MYEYFLTKPQVYGYTVFDFFPYKNRVWQGMSKRVRSNTFIYLCRHMTIYFHMLMSVYHHVLWYTDSAITVTPFTMKFTLCTSIEAKFQWKLTCLSVHCPSIIQTDVKWNRKFMNFIYQLHISSVKNRSRQTVPDTYRDKNPTYNIPNERES